MSSKAYAAEGAAHSLRLPSRSEVPGLARAQAGIDSGLSESLLRKAPYDIQPTLNGEHVVQHARSSRLTCRAHSGRWPIDPTRAEPIVWTCRGAIRGPGRGSKAPVLLLLVLRPMPCSALARTSSTPSSPTSRCLSETATGLPKGYEAMSGSAISRRLPCRGEHVRPCRRMTRLSEDAPRTHRRRSNFDRPARCGLAALIP